MKSGGGVEINFNPVLPTGYCIYTGFPKPRSIPGLPEPSSKDDFQGNARIDDTQRRLEIDDRFFPF